MPDELNSGSHADGTDISKTFDADETFDKVPHRCNRQDGTFTPYLPIGSECPKCGQVVKKQT